jgi:hypothetical protein
MSRWRLALLLLVGVAYAGLSHWMTLFHATAPWAVVVLLGPLWLAAMGFAASWFGRWGFAAHGGAGHRRLLARASWVKRAIRTVSMCCSTWASTARCAAGSAPRCAAAGCR